MAARDPTKKFTFSVRTRTLFWRRAEDDGKEAHAPPRRVTLGQLPFLPHSAETLNGLSRLDRACLAFCRFVVARRVLSCCMIAGLYSLLAGAGVALGCLDLSPNYQYEWVIDAKRSTRNHDMRRAAVAAVDALSSYEEVAPRTDEHLPTWVEYAAAPHVFTSENLQKICQVEARFYGEPSYQKVCVMDEGACAAPAASALTAFYGADHLQRLARGNATCELLNEETVAQTFHAMVAAANASTAGRLTHGMFMAKGAIETGLSPKTRSLLYVGAPLENFASTTDRTAEQYDTYQEYVEKVETKLMAHFGVAGSVVRSAYLEPWTRDGLEFKAFSYLLQRLEWLRLQEMDSLWMAITICFVALWIRVHTGSLKFAAAATLQILLSIPVTALIYRYIIGFEYFAFLHLCSIFVVLGIGADDNFVLLDAWRQASNDVPSGDEAVLRRLLYAFDRARDAIFNTSLTTAVAFLCLGASPWRPRARRATGAASRCRAKSATTAAASPPRLFPSKRRPRLPRKTTTRRRLRRRRRDPVRDPPPSSPVVMCPKKTCK